MDWGFVVALTALGISIAAMWEQRIHNRLTVRPIGMITFTDYLNEISVSLENNGSGPLIVDSLRCFDKDLVVHKKIIDFFDHGFNDIIWETFSDSLDSWAILPGKKKTLLKFTGDFADKSFLSKRKRIRRLLGNLEVVVVYSDVYGKYIGKVTRELKFFHRN